jgi:hypothetical protein
MAGSVRRRGGVGLIVAALALGGGCNALFGIDGDYVDASGGVSGTATGSGTATASSGSGAAGGTSVGGGAAGGAVATGGSTSSSAGGGGSGGGMGGPSDCDNQCSCNGATCDITCSTPPCGVACDGAAVCTGECANAQCKCENASSCSFLCVQAPCTIKCEDSSCVLDCGSLVPDSVDCRMSECTGTETLCPDNKTIVCDALCP